jgi:hypothetical protein
LALIFTLVVSRYSFVWLSHGETVTDVIAGFEAAWRFYGGVIGTAVPDNLKAIVDRADPLSPRLTTPRQAPGGRVTDPEDLPTEWTAYALRDLDQLRRLAAGHGSAIGAMADWLLHHPLPSTEMRQVYALLELVMKWGAQRVEAACGRALDAEAVNVGIVGRMLDRGTENGATSTSTRRRRRRPARWSPPASPGTPASLPPGAQQRAPKAGGDDPAPTVNPELRSLLRRVKLGKLLDTLPERLALAKTNHLNHGEFFELLLADEVTRRDTAGAALRARTAGLDPSMTMDTVGTPPRSPSTKPPEPSSARCASSTPGTTP